MGKGALGEVYPGGREGSAVGGTYKEGSWLIIPPSSQVRAADGAQGHCTLSGGLRAGAGVWLSSAPFERVYVTMKADGEPRGFAIWP